MVVSLYSGSSRKRGSPKQLKYSPEKLKMAQQNTGIFSNIFVFLKKSAKGKLSKMHKIHGRT
jgi:hypothetical protein